MDVRCHLTGLGLLLLMFEPVTLDVSVIGYKEGEVILPCTHTGSNISVTLSDQEIIFMWRFKDSIFVYDFVQGKDDLSQQDNQFKGRTSLSDPRKGNFSLRLKNLTVNDSGQYTCFVLGSQSKQLVMLTIKEKLPQTQSPEPKKDPGNSCIQIGPQKLVLLLIFLISGLSM